VEIEVELFVLLAVRGADILDLLLLRVGEVQLRGEQACAVPEAVKGTGSGSLGDGDRRRCHNHQCNDNLFHDVESSVGLLLSSIRHFIRGVEITPACFTLNVISLATNTSDRLDRIVCTRP
jgi:hypothetical protein